MQCSNCGGQDIVKLSLIYEGGVAIHTTHAVGGFVGNRDGVAVSTATTTTVSASAQRAAPPRKKGLGWQIVGYFYATCAAVITIVMLGTVISAMVSGNIATVIGGILFGAPFAAIAYLSFRALLRRTRKTIEYNQTTYPQEVALWQRQYQCRRCGDIMVPAA